MENYKLKMTLQSDAMPGAGDSVAGIIDSDVCYDRYGICYIPAKRVKGILREAALELKDLGRITAEEVDKLFGKSGMGHHGAKWRLGNGYPENYTLMRSYCQHLIKSKQYAGIFSQDAVLSYFTYLRTQTAIDDSIGVAEKNSLRTIRVLRKGLQFEFDLQIDASYRKQLELICRVTRKFGLNRTRGLGNIVISLAETNSVGDNTANMPQEKPQAIYALHYTLENSGQPFITNSLQGTAASCDTFIPGASILGAFAQKWLEHNANTQQAHTKDEFRSLFLTGHVKFLHAYLYAEAERLLPVPQCLVQDKHLRNYVNLLHTTDIAKKKVHGYLNSSFDTLAQPETCIRYHHQRPSNDRSAGHPTGETGKVEDTGQFFQYEAMASDQQFGGVIVGTLAHLQRLMTLVPSASTIHVGKSKTAEYGKMTVTYEKPEVFTGEIPQQQDWKPNTSLAITLTSPLILRNKNGMITPDPQLLVDILEKRLQTTLILENKFVSVATVCGFMAIWNMPKPQMQALAAGSVLVLKNTGNKELALDFLRDSYGLRSEEGFGRMIAAITPEKFDLSPPYQGDTCLPGTTTGEVNNVVCHILNNYVGYLAKKQALNRRGKLRRGMATNAFIGRILAMCKQAENFAQLNAKFADLRSTAADSLQKLRKDLFIENVKVDKKEQLVANENAFRKILANNLSKIDGLNELVKHLSLQDWWHSKLYSYYVLFVETYLQLLKYLNRGE